MKEIGGYIEFEDYHLPMLHEEAIALNCGRNCLAYLIIAKNISKIVLPHFLCDSVKKVCNKYNVDIRYYSIAPDFLPAAVELQENEWMYIVNYYGQLNKEQIRKLAKTYGNIIVDQAQAYFESPIKGVDTLYTCRKFLGVADGAFLYSDVQLNEELQIDESFSRMRFLLGRYERTASEFYSEYAANNDLFANEPIKSMSKLTKNLLRGINYQTVKKKRTDNYSYLFASLNGINKLNLYKIEGAFAYPLLINNGESVRKKLIENKIYVPLLWPNVAEETPEDSLEFQYAKNILPLPCDQRYDENNMSRLCEILMRHIDI